MFDRVSNYIKENKVNFNLKSTLLVVLLIAICITQFLQNKKINEIYDYINNTRFRPTIKREFRNINRNPKREFISHIRGNFLENLNHDIKDMDNIKERFEDEMEKYYEENKSEFNSKNINGFDIKMTENYDKIKNEYTLKLSVPTNFTEKDITLNIEDNLLFIKINKNFKNQNGEEKIENSFSSLKIISLPKTAAKTQDIKKNFENNIITIIIPIIN